jgi:hypothetical protein
LALVVKEVVGDVGEVKGSCVDSVTSLNGLGYGEVGGV